jgi:membrane protease YdiL (CAAX protease family)|tara:strand:+ start:1940 stop:2512 length:573 start_codon:yes stop_codon:yes gene_type:complete
LTRLFVVALVGEGLLTVVAVLWIRLRGLAVVAGEPVTGLWLGCGAAAALAFLNYGVLRLAPPIQPVRSIRRLYRETLRPLFAAARPLEIVGVSVAAGVGEELLFRGAVQAEFGLVVASVLFGLAHVGGRSSLVFGVWVAVIGVALGWLAHVAGGLLAPIVAHAAYDTAAISYIRWDAAVRGGSQAAGSRR